jgi:uncharacterized protein
LQADEEFRWMDHDRYSDEYIRELLSGVKTVAVVGASPNNVRPSYFVLRYLVSKGYDVVAINPGHAGIEIGGAMTYASLADVPFPIDMVDVFRNSQAAAGVVDEALALKSLPKVIWMQLGVRNDDAARKAEAAGVRVVMNRCPKIEYARLAGEIGWAGVSSGVISSRKPELSKGFQRYGLDKKPG